MARQIKRWIDEQMDRWMNRTLKLQIGRAIELQFLLTIDQNQKEKVIIKLYIIRSLI